MKKLQKLLEASSSLFLDYQKLIPIFDSLSKEDLDFINNNIGESWTGLSSKEEKIAYICRGETGHKLRKLISK